MAVYKYSPIDLERPAIRLIRLHKGYHIEGIRCDLFDGWIGQIDGGIPYEALSYTWGTMRLAATISVNSSTMYVTSNLCAALRRLRSVKEDRILWIDAICIDQDNAEERRHQVQQMCSTYKEAYQVIIWLGEGTEETDFIMDAMKRLQDMKQLRESSIGVESDWRHSAQLWMCKHGLEGINIDENARWRKGMQKILNRPWFQRIWILQEVANARVATIHCGEKSVSARTFAQVPSIIGLETYPRCQAVLDIMPGISRENSWWREDRSLHTLLIKFGNSEATDKRDIIYALLGISSDACQSAILLPDYRKPLKWVIDDTVLYLLGCEYHIKSNKQLLDWTLPELLYSLKSLSSTTFQKAVINGHEEITRLLLTKHKVDVDLRKNGGKTPLLQAATIGHKALVQVLLEHGAEVESKDNAGQTPLIYAIKCRGETIVRLLLENGADVESKDNVGRMPLAYAVKQGDETIIRLLLENGAKVESKDSEGRTPLSYALLYRNKKVVELLESRKP